ncbi:MAG: hypothetical protein HOP29_05270 [Phycisphaerales bacterium]|nr:hypothetical protein [Phycisphaerales bacterium]
MSAPIPVTHLFDFEFPLAYRRRPPAVDGSLEGWTDRELLPLFSELDGRRPFAPVWSCWNDEGLYIATRIIGKRLAPVCDVEQYWKGDNLRVMTDTRDTRDNRRATRFCRQFYFLPVGGGAAARNPVGGSAPVVGAIEHSREAQPPVTSKTGVPKKDDRPDDDGAGQARAEAGTVHVASRVTANGYALEGFISREALVGFDPDEHPRIGFFYMLEDREFGQQYLTIGDELNWHMDPSTWATAVLAR